MGEGVGAFECGWLCWKEKEVREVEAIEFVGEADLAELGKETQEEEAVVGVIGILIGTLAAPKGFCKEYIVFRGELLDGFSIG